MSRRNREQAEKAGMEASEAGRVLQSQRTPAESNDPVELSEKPEGIRPSLRNEPRRLAMEEVIDRHNKTQGIEEPKDEPKLEPKAEPEEPKPAIVEPEKVEALETPIETPPVIATVKVKIDGQESDVPQTEIDEYGGIKAYQISKAADKRLNAANDVLAQAKKWVQQQVAARQPKAQSSDELIASKIDVIRYGTQEESAAALKEILATNRIDQDQLETRINLKRDIQQAAVRFKEEFSDIAANPMLLRFAHIREQEILNTLEAIPSDWNVVYRGIGNEIRSVIGRPNQSTTPTQASTTSSPDKETRKASITNLPTAASRAELPKEQKQETREDVLNQMRKARGLPTG